MLNVVKLILICQVKDDKNSSVNTINMDFICFNS